jgi:hypothetical protein
LDDGELLKREYCFAYIRAYCDVFYDRIAELHHRDRASEATILGIVAAHELGDLLLGSHAHSPVGIMRPQLQDKDFLVPELGTTTFSHQQTQRISDRLVRIQAEKGLEIVRHGFVNSVQHMRQ